MTDARYVHGFSPLGWASTPWMSAYGDASLALPAGVTISAGPPAHPFAGVLGEQVYHFAAGSELLSGLLGHGTGGTPPTTTKRWSMILSDIIWLPALPAAEASLLSFPNTVGFALNVTPTGLLKIYTGTAPMPLVGTSVATLPTGQWVQLEVWDGYLDSTGAALATHQLVVRIATLTAPPVYTTMINVSANSAAADYAGGFYSCVIGRVTAAAPYAPSPEMYVCNIWGAWEDADHPFGVHRLDLMRPSVAKGVGHLNQWPGNPANVNEALPDGDTTKDSVALPPPAAPATSSQLYQLTPPSYITAADLLTGSVVLGEETFWTLGGKAVTNTLSPMYSDGTTDKLLAANIVSGAYRYELWMVTGTPTGVLPWGFADLGTLQVGVQASTSDTVAANDLFKISCIAVCVPYQKLGETGAPLPPPPVVVSARPFVIATMV